MSTALGHSDAQEGQAGKTGAVRGPSGGLSRAAGAPAFWTLPDVVTGGRTWRDRYRGGRTTRPIWPRHAPLVQMPKKKRPPRPGQFGAAAAAASEVTAKRSKAAEQQKSGTQVLRVLVQDKGAAGNSIAETARSVGQAARQTAHQAAAQRAAEALTPALIDELLGVLLAEVAEEVHEWDLEQDYLVKVEVQRMLIEVVDHVWGQEQQEELLQLYCAYKGPLLRPWRATDTGQYSSGTDYRYLDGYLDGDCIRRDIRRMGVTFDDAMRVSGELLRSEFERLHSAWKWEYFPQDGDPSMPVLPLPTTAQRKTAAIRRVHECNEWGAHARIHNLMQGFSHITPGVLPVHQQRPVLNASERWMRWICVVTDPLASAAAGGPSLKRATAVTKLFDVLLHFVVQEELRSLVIAESKEQELVAAGRTFQSQHGGGIARELRAWGWKLGPLPGMAAILDGDTWSHFGDVVLGRSCRALQGAVKANAITCKQLLETPSCWVVGLGEKPMQPTDTDSDQPSEAAGLSKKEQTKLEKEAAKAAKETAKEEAAEAKAAKKAEKAAAKEAKASNGDGAQAKEAAKAVKKTAKEEAAAAKAAKKAEKAEEKAAKQEAKASNGNGAQAKEAAKAAKQAAKEEDPDTDLSVDKFRVVQDRYGPEFLIDSPVGLLNDRIGAACFTRYGLFEARLRCWATARCRIHGHWRFRHAWATRTGLKRQRSWPQLLRSLRPAIVTRTGQRSLVHGFFSHAMAETLCVLNAFLREIIARKYYLSGTMCQL